MICGVKFCGGCNPHYDRGAALRTLQKEVPQVHFRIARAGETYDFLLVIGGCTSCCPAFSQYGTRHGVAKMWSRDHIEGVRQQIEAAARKVGAEQGRCEADWMEAGEPSAELIGGDNSFAKVREELYNTGVISAGESDEENSDGRWNGWRTDWKNKL
ncbi:MAG: hypothetical protein ACOX41_05520 [Anaerovoracaceae bacterium]